MSLFRLDMKFSVILIVSLLLQGYRIFENNIWVIECYLRRQKIPTSQLHYNDILRNKKQKQHLIGNKETSLY